MWRECWKHDEEDKDYDECDDDDVDETTAMANMTMMCGDDNSHVEMDEGMNEADSVDFDVLLCWWNMI